MPEDQYFRPRNWAKWQDCRHKNAPWVKNFTDLLTDPDYLSLTPNQAVLLHRLWMYCGRVGKPLPLDCRFIGGQLNLHCPTVGKSLPVLLSRNFIELCARTDKLFDRQLVDNSPPEDRGQRTEERKKELLSNLPLDEPPQKLLPKPQGKRKKKGARQYDTEFLAWWSAYPRREAKGDAFDAYWTMRQDHDADALLAGARYAGTKYTDTELNFIPLPGTFLRAERFLEVGQQVNGTGGPQPPEGLTPAERMDWYEQNFMGEET